MAAIIAIARWPHHCQDSKTAQSGLYEEKNTLVRVTNGIHVCMYVDAIFQVLGATFLKTIFRNVCLQGTFSLCDHLARSDAQQPPRCTRPHRRVRSCRKFFWCSKVSPWYWYLYWYVLCIVVLSLNPYIALASGGGQGTMPALWWQDRRGSD